MGHMMKCCVPISLEFLNVSSWCSLLGIMEVFSLKYSNSDRKHGKRRRLNAQSDISGSLRISDGSDYQGKEGKSTSDSRGVLVEQVLFQDFVSWIQWRWHS